ncbi:MAG: flagellar basal body L-ring protein FlgH [Fuerstiella sp.]
MRKIVVAGILFASCIYTVNKVTLAESLWKKRNPQYAYLFVDSKARRVGDLLTIVVTQATNVNSSEDRALAKSSQAGATVNLDSEAGGGFGVQAANAGLNFAKNSNRGFDGESSFRSNQAFTDRMTVSVVDVLPNGNLVVSGHRKVRLVGDERSLTLTGMIRSVDVGPDNSVDSQLISDLQLQYDTVGPTRKFIKQGWLGRATNVVWPF